MSEIEKAIQEIEDMANHPSLKTNITAQSMCLILKALQEKAEREKPKPLTVKQLEKMHGQAVFCVDAKGEGKWALVHPENEACTDGDFGDWEFYEYGHNNAYGWKAYKTEPYKAVEK